MYWLFEEHRISDWGPDGETWPILQEKPSTSYSVQGPNVCDSETSEHYSRHTPFFVDRSLAQTSRSYSTRSTGIFFPLQWKVSFDLYHIASRIQRIRFPSFFGNENRERFVNCAWKDSYATWCLAQRAQRHEGFKTNCESLSLINNVLCSWRMLGTWIGHLELQKPCFGRASRGQGVGCYLFCKDRVQDPWDVLSQVFGWLSTSWYVVLSLLALFSLIGLLWEIGMGTCMICDTWKHTSWCLHYSLSA